MCCHFFYYTNFFLLWREGKSLREIFSTDADIHISTMRYQLVVVCLDKCFVAAGKTLKKLYGLSFCVYSLDVFWFCIHIYTYRKCAEWWVPCMWDGVVLRFFTGEDCASYIEIRCGFLING